MGPWSRIPTVLHSLTYIYTKGNIGFLFPRYLSKISSDPSSFHFKGIFRPIPSVSDSHFFFLVYRSAISDAFGLHMYVLIVDLNEWCVVVLIFKCDSWILGFLLSCWIYAILLLIWCSVLAIRWCSLWVFFFVVCVLILFVARLGFPLVLELYELRD